MDLVFLVRYKERSVEHVMDLPCFREAELICDGQEDFDDCEGSFMFQSKFGVGNGVFEVSSL